MKQINKDRWFAVVVLITLVGSMLLVHYRHNTNEEASSFPASLSRHKY